MKATWASIRVVCQILSLLAAVSGLVFGITSFVTGEREWLFRALLLMVVFSLPAGYADVVESVRGPKPRPSARLGLARWPFLLLPFVIPATFGWAVWFAFGRVWMGTFVAFGGGLPTIALLASGYLMEPGPRKDRVYLASVVAMFAAPVLMIVAFAVVWGK